MSALSAARRESRAAERCCIIVLTRFNSAWIRGRRKAETDTSWGVGSAAGPAAGEGLRAGWFREAGTRVRPGLSRSHSWDSRSTSPWAASISTWDPKMSWLAIGGRGVVEDGRGRRGEASYTLAQGWSPVPGNSLRVTWTRGTVLRSGAVLRFTVSEKKDARLTCARV